MEDRRGAGPGKMVAGGGIGMLLLALVVLLLGGNPLSVLQGGGGGGGGRPLPGGGPGTGGGAGGAPVNDELGDFAKTILAETEDVWTEIFRASNMTYEIPQLVLFRDKTRSGCGFASHSTGPFYCPADEKVYLDLSFFDELARRFDAPGDFAQAYVLAHEVAHHVQRQLGATEYVHSRKGRVPEREYNDLSVRLELQADFYAGVWAHHAHKRGLILEEGDIEEALRAATAIGDDRIQKQAQGYAVPDSFTHGTSEQRMRWFLLGLQTGDPDQGDTFSVETP